MSELAPSDAHVPRRRGRPVGSTSRVLRREQALGVQHFAFLRACLLGLEPKRAWERYLGAAEGCPDLRHVSHRRDALWRQVLEAGRGLAASSGVTEALALLTRARGHDGRASELPTLDEFIEAEGLDRDFHSEAELLALYREHHHLDGAAALARSPRAAVDAQVSALFVIESRLARPPAPDDAVEVWFSAGVAALLRGAGCESLGAAIERINAHGYGWYRRVPRLGEVRARTLVAWLAAAGEAFGCPVDVASCSRPAPRPALDALPPAAPAPLPEAERAAVSAWLERHACRPATRRAYARELERFSSWLRQVCGKGLLAADADDVAAYRGFIGAVPGGWICRRPVPRGDASWRPFRGSLAPASQRLALTAVRCFFQSLGHQHGHRVPPALQVAAGAVQRRPVDWSRLISIAETRAPESAGGRRLVAVLRLARSGVRPSQMAEAGVSALRPPPPAWLPGADGSLQLRKRLPGDRLTAGGIRCVIRRFRARCGELAESFQESLDGFSAQDDESVKDGTGVERFNTVTRPTAP